MNICRRHVDIAATHRSNEFDGRTARQALPRPELPGEVAAAAARPDALALAIEPHDRRAARIGPDKVEKDADGRSLAGAVRTQEAEDLALLHHQVKVIQRQRGTVGARESLRDDRASHAAIVAPGVDAPQPPIGSPQGTTGPGSAGQRALHR